MNVLTRRLAVRALAIPLGATLAGCLDGSGNGGDDPDYELHQVGPTTATRDWGGRDGPTGAVELYRSRSRAEERLDGGILAGVSGDRRDAARAFVADTDFGRSVLLSVASEGPDTCHDEIEVRRLAVEDGTVTGTVAARDTSREGEGCGDAITYPSALVRVTADGRPDGTELTVVNGWGDESVVEASASG